MSKAVKTNAMRQLDAAKIAYTVCGYAVDENDLSAGHIAKEIDLPEGQVFKTIVCHGDKTGYLVFCIPADREIHMKKAAAVTGNKKIEAVHVRDLLGLTGYIRGGCSPVGMKKKFPTFFDESAREWEQITVSAGVRGMVLLLNTADIVRFTDATVADVTGT